MMANGLVVGIPNELDWTNSRDNHVYGLSGCFIAQYSSCQIADVVGGSGST